MLSVRYMLDRRPKGIQELLRHRSGLVVWSLVLYLSNILQHLEWSTAERLRPCLQDTIRNSSLLWADEDCIATVDLVLFACLSKRVFTIGKLFRYRDQVLVFNKCRQNVCYLLLFSA